MVIKKGDYLMVSKVMKMLLVLMMMVLCATPKSYADWGVGIHIGGPGYYHDDGHRFYRWHDHPHWGWHMHYLPAGYFTIWVGGSRYYYYDGLYYSYVGDGDYVLVDPPIGAFVSSIPPDFQPIIVNGRTYYTDNGVYYLLTHRGYKVVAAPVVYAQPQQVVYTQPAPAYAQDAFPINVPNNAGGYTTVVIKKSGNGYVGPQGEFYAQFPSVAQLKAMYAR
jgi:hypothetical protein